MLFESSGPQQTKALGLALGKRLTPGMVVALTGDLGAGKTCLVQGVARGLGVPEDVPVTSPTFTFINEYLGAIPLYHIDLYRISCIEDLDDIGFFECVHGRGASVIEWADRLEPGLLPDHVAVDIQDAGADSRRILIKASGQGPADLVNGLELDFSKREAS